MKDCIGPFLGMDGWVGAGWVRGDGLECLRVKTNKPSTLSYDTNPTIHTSCKNVFKSILKL